MSNWTRYCLPEQMDGKTFLDVGCWWGDCSAEAAKRGALDVLALDICISDDLKENVDRHGFKFLEMDIFSDRFLMLGLFDVVLCGAVLYHVLDPLGLLMRLRRVTLELLVLETMVNQLEGTPVLKFHPGDDLGSNPSNWWTPNVPCLIAMLETVGFEGIEIVDRRRAGMHMLDFDRVCVHARPTGSTPFSKLLPRLEKWTSLYGGQKSKKVVD